MLNALLIVAALYILSAVVYGVYKAARAKGYTLNAGDGQYSLTVTGLHFDHLEHLRELIRGMLR